MPERKPKKVVAPQVALLAPAKVVSHQEAEQVGVPQARKKPPRPADQPKKAEPVVLDSESDTEDLNADFDMLHYLEHW